MAKKVVSISFFVFALLGIYSFANAQEFTYPVPELGNCENKDACAAYCNEPENGPACLDYGIKVGTIDSATAEKLKESLPEGGPGGCHTDKQCRAYCSDAANAQECAVFAEENNLLPPKGVQELKEFAGQTGPAGCRGANECRAYCEDSDHQEECFEFGRRKGLISDQDAEIARRVRQEGGPGGCKNENECRTYCEDSSHLDECLAFAEANGFISKEEAARVKKNGLISGPGGCKGKECRTYCEDPSHQQECIAFAEENGLMSKEEVERAKKFAGKTGPGGCKGEECRTFCENPENAETCLEFAAKEGLMPPQEVERARKFLKVSQDGGPGGCRGEQCREFCTDPANQTQCFEFAKKQGLINPEEEKQFEAGRKIREKLEATGGPGGCKNEDECHTYCTDPNRVEECVAFGAAHGGIPEAEARAMVKDFQERRFEVRQEFRPPEEFKRFEEEASRRFEEFKQLEEQFRGQPFQGGPAGPAGFPSTGTGGFVGPAGCASPAECIQYCSENKEACFGAGEQGRGIREDAVPRLRANLIQEFKPGELPEDFQQKTFEERQQFFKEKFGPPSGTEGEGLPVQSGFPGAPGQFPGQSGQFPGNVPPEFPGKPEQGYKKEDFFFGRPVPPFNQGEKDQSEPPVWYQKFDEQNQDVRSKPNPSPTPLPAPDVRREQFTPPPSGSFERQIIPAPAPAEFQTTPAPSSGGGEPPPPPPSSGLNNGFLASILHFFVQ